jgi:hypothetical protein
MREVALATVKVTRVVGLTLSVLSGLQPSYCAEANPVAVVVNSGSTNVAGYRIELPRSGSAKYSEVPRRGPYSQSRIEPQSRQLPKAIVERFYADLAGAEPLSQLPHETCMKSASFGITLVIEFGEQRSPDLACGDGGNSKLRALIQDVNDIVRLMNPE